MDSMHTEGSSRLSLSNWLRRLPWLLIPIMALSFTTARTQQLTATLSGLAADQSDARVPNADVVVKNEGTGDIRATKADSSGFFSVTALIPGSYSVTITAKGFTKWEETGIVLSQGDSRTVPNIHLKVGGETQAVTVISGSDADVPVDTAEISATLNNELVDSATLTGRNAAELIKMMPGVVFNNGGSSGSAYNSQVTGTNNGPAGSFSANGTQPYGSTDVYLDGANLIDPGNAGTQVANINQDMTDSVKYLSASYGAEYAKGPAVLQAFSKSGTQRFHGEAYLYARNTGFGYANDWNNKFQQESAAASKPGATPASIAAANKLTDQSFYYIGGNIGGPVIIPGLGFNKNRDKLFFWGGYEKMIQHPYNAPVNINVPTDAQLAGDFSNTGVPSGALSQYPYAYSIPCNSGASWQGCDSADSPWMPKGGSTAATIPNLKPYFDPYGAAATALIPHANQTPSAANGQANYAFSPATPQDRWEATGKVTYAFNDNNKLWGTYAYQSEVDEHPLSIWWAPANTVPYPSNPVGNETAHVYLANFTHIFSATSTNEFVFAYSEFVNNNSETKPSAVSDKALGFPSESLYGSSHAVDQIPNFFDSWSGQDAAIGEMSFNGGIYGKGTFGKTSKAPSIADTFTKIVGTHSLKAGFYWDTQENLQSTSNNFGDGGAWAEYDVSPWDSTGTSNIVLDRLLGRNASYTEQSTEPVPDIKWHQWSLWAQDSWKATRKLTLNVGLRADHMGQWYDTLGDTQVWDPATYNNTSSAAPNTGLLWHKLNSSIPSSGWSSALFFYDPRVGAAYDIFGTGKTVLRVGFGTYRYQVSSNDSSAAMNGPLGSFNFSTNNAFYGYHVNGGAVYTNQAETKSFQYTVPSGLNQNGSGPAADKKGDNEVPYANTYSFGIAQALPGHTVMEASYVGSMSRNQILIGQSNLGDPNAVPIGAFFKADPKTGVVVNPNPVTPGGPTFTANDYRPLVNYQAIKLYQHGGYANYNSLQVSAQKQSGNLFIFSNFTFGKVLGTRDGATSNGNGNGNVLDPFHLSANYGPLAYDHTKVFNASYSYKLPSPIHGNAFLAGPINGWQISGYTTYQDGANLQASNPVLNATYCTAGTTGCPGTAQAPFTMPSGQTSQTINPSTWFGTNEYPNAVIPILTCNPAKGLRNGQQFNPSCFAAPIPPTATTYGQQGPNIWPYLRNPHYWGSDMAVFKAFRINDSQRIEARISATNWLNHPNSAFNLSGTNSDIELLFPGYSSGSAMVSPILSSTTGIPTAKVGYRWLQFAAKYYF